MVEAPNPKCPISTGQVKVFGVEGVKEATYVPSPRWKSAEQLVEFWYDEKYGKEGVMNDAPSGYLRAVGSPWNRAARSRYGLASHTSPTPTRPAATSASSARRCNA